MASNSKGPRPSRRTQLQTGVNVDVNGVLLAPVRAYCPLDRAGLELLRGDMTDIREHLEAISVMLPEEATLATRRLTGTKARQLQQRMEQLLEIRNANPNDLASIDFRMALEAYKTIRDEYLVLLPRQFRIDDLPLELLTQIFRMSIWPLSGTNDDLERAVRLSHVSRLWRAVAISDRKLWNPIFFAEPMQYERGFAMMERAGPTGLDVCIEDKQTAPIPPNSMRNLIDKVFHWVHGIKRLYVSVYTTEAILPVIEALGRISQLESPVSMESVTLQSLQSTTAPYPPTLSYVPQPLFGGTIPPFFKHLSLAAVKTQWEVNLFSKLTTLDLQRLVMETLPSSAMFRAILQNAAALEKLVLDAAGPMHPPNIPHSPPVVLKRLRTLVIGGCSDMYFYYMLGHFEAPNVLDLTVCFPVSSNHNRLFASLTNSNRMPLVRVLKLRDLPKRNQPFPHGQAALLSNWLNTMPDLAFLRIINTSPALFEVLAFDQTTLRSVGEGDSHPHRSKRLILPKLKYLDWQADYADLQQVRDCLSIRKSFGHAVQRLWLAPKTAGRLEWQDAMGLRNCLGEDGFIFTSQLRTDEEDLLCPLVYPPASV